MRRCCCAPTFRCATDLRGHLDALSALRARAVIEAGDAPARTRQRISARLPAIAELDPERLAQEIAILADRADISEELARLESHIVQARAALESGEPVGRRLEFLAQEMHREINTTGAKVNESALSHLVVEMKSVLERVREQGANVE